MSQVELPKIPPDLPEWRRSGRFFVLAVALHGLLLAYPLHTILQTAPLPLPLELQLVAQPAAVASSPAAPPAEHPPARKEKAVLRPEVVRAEPVLAIRAERAVANPVVPVPPAPLALESPVRPAATAVTAVAAGAATGSGTVPPSAPTMVPAKFNAAYLNNPKPKYPAISRRLGEEGRVLLRVRVTADGVAASVDLEKSSNFERLDDAAKQAVARWRFVPARRGEDAVEAMVIVPVDFRLES